MLGAAIAAQAIALGGLRQLATEQAGPRPGGVRRNETSRRSAEMRLSRASRP